MSKKSDDFKDIIESEFNTKKFTLFSKEFFNDIKIISSEKYNEERSNFSYYVDGYYHIGNYISQNNEKVAVLAICLKNGTAVERARSMQRNFAKKLIENSGSTAAFVAFYTKDNADKWRLSFIKLDYEFSEGKIKEKITPAKRYSYLVGKKEPSHTAKERLFPIYDNEFSNPSVAEIEDEIVNNT